MGGLFASGSYKRGVTECLVLWPVLVYAPVARWVWHADGWLAKLGHLDWAGGSALHADSTAAIAIFNTLVAGAAGAVA